MFPGMTLVRPTGGRRPQLVPCVERTCLLVTEAELLGPSHGGLFRLSPLREEEQFADLAEGVGAVAL